MHCRKVYAVQSDTRRGQWSVEKQKAVFARFDADVRDSGQPTPFDRYCRLQTADLLRWGISHSGTLDAPVTSGHQTPSAPQPARHHAPVPVQTDVLPVFDRRTNAQGGRTLRQSVDGLRPELVDTVFIAVERGKPGIHGSPAQTAHP